MKYNIALISDIHGNYHALKAVIEDCQKQEIQDYWLLGDVFLPGPGDKNILDLLKPLPISVSIRGNWEDCFLEAIDGGYTTASAGEIYLLRLSQYLKDRIDPEAIEALRQKPMTAERVINGLSITISHNLPNKNWGRYLLSGHPTEHFDALFCDKDYDIAIFGHIHQQLLRYSSKGQMIINPGAVGQAYFPWEPLRQDLRAQYAILTIDDQGYSNINFRKVAYDVKAELKLAQQQELPYLEIYKELLETGVNRDKDPNYLKIVNDKHHYAKEVEEYFGL